MEANKRREKILFKLNQSNMPIVARELAEEFQVSRQVIVGDIALLRASGEEVLSTPKGYLLNRHLSSLIKKKIVCEHTNEQTEDEINIIIDLGGKLYDVSVEHPVYGEINGTLNILDKEDAKNFIHKVKNRETSLLLELTNGVHTHTVAAESAETLETIEQALGERGYLYTK